MWLLNAIALGSLSCNLQVLHRILFCGALGFLGFQRCRHLHVGDCRGESAPNMDSGTIRVLLKRLFPPCLPKVRPNPSRSSFCKKWE